MSVDESRRKICSSVMPGDHRGSLVSVQRDYSSPRRAAGAGRARNVRVEDKKRIMAQ